jgi:hypothetical protein
VGLVRKLIRRGKEREKIKKEEETEENTYVRSNI